MRVGRMREQEKACKRKQRGFALPLGLGPNVGPESSERLSLGARLGTLARGAARSVIRLADAARGGPVDVIRQHSRRKEALVDQLCRGSGDARQVFSARESLSR